MSDEEAQQRCERCNRASSDILCLNCVTRLHRALDEIHEFSAMVDSAVPATRGVNPTRSSERTLGVNIDALDVIAGNDTLPLMESWEIAIRHDFDLTPYGVVTEQQKHSAMLRERTDFIKAWLTRLLETRWPLLLDMHREITAEAARLARVACVDEHDGWRVECPTDVEDGMCRRRLRVTRDDLDSDAEVLCRSCKRVWTARRLVVVSAAAQDIDVWVPAETLAEWYGVTKRTLRRWVKQGLIERRGRLLSDRSMRRQIAFDSV